MRCNLFPVSQIVNIDKLQYIHYVCVLIKTTIRIIYYYLFDKIYILIIVKNNLSSLGGIDVKFSK